MYLLSEGSKRILRQRRCDNPRSIFFDGGLPSRRRKDDTDLVLYVISVTRLIYALAEARPKITKRPQRAVTGRSPLFALGKSCVEIDPLPKIGVHPQKSMNFDQRHTITSRFSDGGQGKARRLRIPPLSIGRKA